MQSIQKITTSYIPQEDRVRIDAQLEDSSVVAMWITQRLLLRLIPLLSNCLDVAYENIREQNLPDSSPQQPERLRTEEAVDCSAHTRAILIHSVDINTQSDRLSLVFKSDPILDLTLPLTNNALEQWLAIFNKLWKIAEWPEHIWTSRGSSNKHLDTENNSFVIH